MNATSQTPIQCTAFHQYTSFTKKIVPPEIQTHFYINTPHFPHFQIWTFWPHQLKNLNFTNSFLEHYPQPKLNQNSSKDPKLILILTMKLVYTYFWKSLLIGDLIWLTLTWLAFSNSSQIMQTTSNHLKKWHVWPQKQKPKAVPYTQAIPWAFGQKKHWMFITLKLRTPLHQIELPAWKCLE